MNALSKSFGSSEAPTSFAIAVKRAWRWASVSLGFACDLRGILAFLPLFRGPKATADERCYSDQSTENITTPRIKVVSDHTARHGASEKPGNPKHHESQHGSM